MSHHTHIVRASAILCPPHVDRTFHQGEAVGEADFARLPGAWEKALRTNAVAPLLDWEPEVRAAAEALRARNTRTEFGLPADAPEEAVQAKLDERRAAYEAERQEAEAAILRAVEARRALADPTHLLAPTPEPVPEPLADADPAPLDSVFPAAAADPAPQPPQAKVETDSLPVPQPLAAAREIVRPARGRRS